MGQDTILDIVEVKKQYGASQALKGVSLRVQRGEFVALVGPSGCGKTTLLKQVAGFEHPDSGRIAIEGQDMAGVPASDRPTSMVFQKLALFPHMTVAQNIGFPLKLRARPADEIARKVREMADLMHLKPDYLDRFPRQLSGGEQQRVALARSMISAPKLLLLDEPLSALDVKLKKILQAELKRLHRSLGVTFVHVTHDLEEAMMLADRICVMRAGQALQVGRPNDIYYRPADEFVAGFIGETNLLEVEVVEVRADSILYRGPDIADVDGLLPRALATERVAPGPARLMVRPELLELAKEGERYPSTVAAQITETFGKGGAIQFRAVTPGGQAMVVEVPGTSHWPARLGDKVRLGWHKRDIYLLQGRA
jgi:ABC-type Fe3+/spermidine/putrescine transport system ATPase subunit